MELIRPAGLNELRCIARDDLKLYGSIISVAEYAGPKELHQADFIKALKQCVVEHAVLSIAIQDAETEHPTLCRVESLDLAKHCNVRNDSSQKFLEVVHNEPFLECSSRPQWAIVVQPTHGDSSEEPFRFHVAFACSHNLADGMSGPQFHTTFLQALGDLKNFEFDENPIWQPPKAATLPPLLERAGKLTISWTFLLGPLLNEYLPSSLASMLGFRSATTEAIWKGALTRPHQLPLTTLVPTKVFQTFVTPETLKSVLVACKTHNSRLTGLLTHLTARGLARALKTRDQDFAHFTTSITINMRKALKSGEGQMANYPSSTEETVEVQPRHLQPKAGMSTEDWEAVAAITKRLEEKSSTLADQPVGLLAYLSDFRGWTIRNASAPAKVSFEVSNVGVLDGGSGGDWGTRDLVFSQSADASGPPMSINVGSAKGGKLNLAFVWSPGALGVDDEAIFVEEVAKEVTSILRELAGL